MLLFIVVIYIYPTNYPTCPLLPLTRVKLNITDIYLHLRALYVYAYLNVFMYLYSWAIVLMYLLEGRQGGGRHNVSVVVIVGVVMVVDVVVVRV